MNNAIATEERESRTHHRATKRSAWVIVLGLVLLIVGCLTALPYVMFRPSITTSLAGYDKVMKRTQQVGTSLYIFPTPASSLPSGSRFYGYGGPMQAASYMGLYVPGQPDEIAKAVRGITPTAPNELHAQMRRYPSVIMGHMTVVMRIDPPEAEWYIPKSRRQGTAVLPM